MAIGVKQNMGTADRIARGLLGGFMLVDGLINIGSDNPLRKAEAGVGAAFLIYGITGFDPLLKVSGASTIRGAEDNIINQLKQMAPGQGINPMLVQQPIPKRKVREVHSGKSLAERLAIR